MEATTCDWPWHSSKYLPKPAPDFKERRICKGKGIKSFLNSVFLVDICNYHFLASWNKLVAISELQIQMNKVVWTLHADSNMYFFIDLVTFWYCKVFIFSMSNHKLMIFFFSQLSKYYAHKFIRLHDISSGSSWCTWLLVFISG